ncbi:DUF1697 domain-containing protein [Gymnodinialimonas sp. 2305UL16-5]|uniref:DUF1697 domain-containing protein n=1 Tax=Gymnodinialimonas mytili TaxID=3126503 RepID=UPI0030A81C9A
MTRRVAFLRAVNVGGTGKLPMADLRALAAEIGFDAPETHLASGNLLFGSDLDDDMATAHLETALQAHMGAPCPVFLRDAQTLTEILDQLPFEGAEGSRVGILFGSERAISDDLAAPKHQTSEELAIVARHLAVHFPDGMGKSKLALPIFHRATMRNRNTVAAIAKKLSP